ncbi:MAG: Crp/Fnr family transcriptional regulator [Acidobacteriota bacterium]
MLKTVEKVLLLQDLDLFSLVSTDQLAQLALIAEDKEVPPGVPLFSRGDEASKLYLVVQGKVRSEDGNGKSWLVERAGLDFWSVFSESRHAVSARTVQTSTVLVVRYDDFVDLLTGEPEFCLALIRYLAGLGRERVEAPA